MIKRLLTLILLIVATATAWADDVQMEAVVSHTMTTEYATVNYGRVTRFTIGQSMNFTEVYNDGNYGFITPESVCTFGDGILYMFQPKMVNNSGIRELSEVRFLRYTRDANGNWSGTYDYKNCGNEYTAYPHFMAYDPQSKTIYGVRNGEQTILYTINPTTGAMTQSLVMDRYYSGMAINAFGEAYAIDFNGYLYSLDLKTGKGTRIGQTGHSGDDVQALAFDYETGRLIQGYIFSDKHTYYELDLKTAKATMIGAGPSSDKLRCILSISEANMKAPDTPTGLNVKYAVPGERKATLSATAPTKLFDKTTSLSGNVTLHFSVNGTEVGTVANLAAGSKGSMDYTFPADGAYTVSVQATNDEGHSPSLSATTYAGFDTPQTPADIAFTVDDDGNYNLNWSAPVQGIYNGEINQPTLHYTVIAYPSETKTEGLTTTHLEGKLTGRGLNDYYFTVQAFADEKASPVGESNHIVYGAGVDLPFTETFDTDEYRPLYNIVDGNGDGKTWAYSGGVLDDYTLSYNGNQTSQAAQEWFLMPPVRLHKGATYSISSRVYSAYGQTTGNHLAYYLLSDTNPKTAEVCQQLADYTDIPDYLSGAEDGFTTIATDYVAEKDGLAYFAIYCHSNAGRRVFIADFNIKTTSGVAAPLDVTDLTCENTAPGSRSVVLTFKAPTLDKEGNSIKAIDRITVYVDDVLTPLDVIYDAVPGQQYSRTVTYDESGQHTFRVVVDTENGQSEGVSSSIWLGEDFASPVTNLKAHLDENDNIVLTWDAPTTSVNGGYVDFEHLTYYVTAASSNGEGDMNDMASGLTETTCTIDGSLFGSGYQISLTFWVFPVTTSGFLINNKVAYTYFCYGPAYNIPYSENFGLYYHNSSPWSTQEILAEGQRYASGWKCVSDSYSGKVIKTATSIDDAGVTAQYHQNEYSWYEERLISPKVSIKDADDPVLTFYMYHTQGEEAENQLRVEAYDVYSGEYLTLGLFPVGEGTGWTKHGINLTDIQEEGVNEFRICFHGEAAAGVAFYVDSVELTDKTTSVALTTFEPIATPKVYDLQGRRVNAAGFGPRIVDGKKTLK